MGGLHRILAAIATALASAAAATSTAWAQQTDTKFGIDALASNTAAGLYNTAFGFGTLRFNTSGIANTGIGDTALVSNIDGNNNTASGSFALYTNQHGSFNTATGFSALRYNTESFNTAYGESALFYNANGTNNTAVGAEVMFANASGNYNTAIGNRALYVNAKGNDNTASGAGALYNNIDGDDNTASGADALLNSIGSFNTAIGTRALRNNQNGSGNTASGVNALLSNTSGSNNIAIGFQAGANLTSGDGNVYIASPGPPPSPVDQEFDTIRIGNATPNIGFEIQTKAFIAGVYNTGLNGNNSPLEVVIDNNGQLGTIGSSVRFKEDIKDMADYSRRLFDLRPVTFRYKHPEADGDKPLEPGLIAEEVADVYPDLVAHGANGQIQSVQYYKLTPMLLNELQNQERQLAAETAKLDSEAKRNAALETEVWDLKASLAEARRSQDVLADRLAKLESTSRASGVQ